jgi:hypothetical protein
MSVFQSDIDVLDACISAWGVKGNRGSHADYLALLAARNVIRNDLRMLALYAQNTKPDNVLSWADLGFKNKRPKSKPQPLQMVQNFHHFISRSVPAPGIKLKWNKPLDTARKAVKWYAIQRNNSPECPLASEGENIANIIGIVTNTSFIDSDPFDGENWYWVTPFNSLGFGVISEAVMVVSSRI